MSPSTELLYDASFSQIFGWVVGGIQTHKDTVGSVRGRAGQHLLEQLCVGAGVELVLVSLSPQHGERVGVHMAGLGHHRGSQGGPAGVEAGGSCAPGRTSPGRRHPRGGRAGGEAAGGGGLGGTLTTHSENIST